MTGNLALDLKASVGSVRSASWTTSKCFFWVKSEGSWKDTAGKTENNPVRVQGTPLQPHKENMDFFHWHLKRFSTSHCCSSGYSLCGSYSIINVVAKVVDITLQLSKLHLKSQVMRDISLKM